MPLSAVSAPAAADRPHQEEEEGETGDYVHCFLAGREHQGREFDMQAAHVLIEM